MHKQGLNMNKAVKYIALVLLFSFLLRFGFVIIHAKHECNHDETCPVCFIINTIVHEFDGFDPNLEEVLTIILILFSPYIYISYRNTFNKSEYTLIGLKVELIN